MGDQRKQRLPFYTFLFITFGHLITSLSPPPTVAPLFHRPFVLLWNAPISKCQQLKVPLDLSLFQAVTTPARECNQSLTLFYKNRIGLYPYVDLHSLKEYNGGIPQRGNLSSSLDKAKEEFTQYTLDSTPGLAVMDWEEWLPMFDRNLDDKEIYKELSVNYTLQQNPSLDLQEAFSDARLQFQQEARCFMEETLKMGIDLRPQHLWGYYLFPDCYNYDFEESNYTGTCSEQTNCWTTSCFGCGRLALPYTHQHICPFLWVEAEALHCLFVTRYKRQQEWQPCQNVTTLHQSMSTYGLS